MIGLHFFSPANVMKLLEVIRGEKTGKRCAGYRDGTRASKIRKTAVVSGVCDGFIGNRMIEQYGASGRPSCLTKAARRRRLTSAIEKFGFMMGPFRMGDLAGNDIGWAIRKRRYRGKAST